MGVQPVAETRRTEQCGGVHDRVAILVIRQKGASRMKRWLVCWSMVAVGLGGGACGAADEVKVGYVDAQQVLDRAKSGQASKEQLEQYVKSRQQLIDVDEEEIRRLEEELKKQAAVLSPEGQQAN